jgi:hypothetical protein
MRACIPLGSHARHCGRRDVLCALVFIKGLGVPLPLIGRWFSGWFGG